MSPLRTIYTRISQGSVLLPIVFGLIHYKKLNPAFRILFYYLIVSGMEEITGTIMGRICGNNRPIMHLDFFLANLVFSTIFYKHFHKKRLLSVLIVTNICIGVIVALTDAFIINSIWRTAIISRPYTSISITVYALIFFYYHFKSDQMQNAWSTPMFQLSIGCLLLFGGNMLYFMLMDKLIAKHGPNEIFGWSIYDLLNVIANYFYAQAFRCFRKSTT